MDESSSFLMEKLRAKGGTYKPFKEYAKSLRMTLMEKRYALEISEKNYLQECLDLLQQNILVSTLPAIIERLEVISRHLGLKFVSGPSRLEWFISSDMFYVEVVLEASGHIKDVKIHHDGTGERQGQSCEELKTTLENRDFKDFTLQLEGLISIYNLNADQKVKSKAFNSLQYLEADIMQLSNLQYSFVNDPFDIIHKSDVGLVQKRRGGHPMKIIYFISPYDLLDITRKTYKPLTLDLPEVDYSVSLCLESSSTNKLQTQNLVKVIKSEKMEENSDMEQPTPLFEELNTSNTNLLPACFVMKLKTRMPISEALIHQMKEITDIEVTKIEGPYPILSLIKREIHKKFVECEEDSSIVTLPDQRHCYIMTNNNDLQAYIVQSIPFSHPSHVSKILPLLRQQALFNSFIASCIRPKAGEDSCDKLNQNFSEVMHCDSEYTNGFGLKLFGSEDFKSLSIFNELPQKSVPSHITMFEVMPLSLQLITVSFEHPIDETLITAELDLTDVSDLRCNISTASEDSNTSVSNAQECAGRALQRSFSIPATMRVLIRLWESQTDTSDEEDLNESSTNNDVTDLNENAENNMETESGKENGDCPSVEFSSSRVTINTETSDSCENSLDGFPSLTTRNGELNTDDVFAVPNPSLRHQAFDLTEMLPTANSYSEASISFLDNTNEQPMFEPKNETADSVENSFFKSKSCVTDLFIPKGQRMNDCEIVIDSSSDSEMSEATVVATAAAVVAAATREVVIDSKDPSPGSNSSLEFSALTELASDLPSEKERSDFEIDPSMMEVNNLEEVQKFLKLTENKISKNDEINGGSKTFSTSIMSDLDGKNLVSPSVSITPVTTTTQSSSSSSSMNVQQCTQNLQNVLTSMCLDRRPGIDVSMTPFASSSPTLPASLTITPINVKETGDIRIKDRKSQKIDKGRLEKKKKRKHDDSPMGPPEKIPAKSDPLSRPVSVSIKPTAGNGESVSPRSPSSCNSTQRKFTVSPTQSASLSLLGKISPNSNASPISVEGNNMKLCKSQSGVGSMPATSLTNSPKMCIPTSNVSPKHSITSPKNVLSGSAGKPSLSALKSVTTSPSSSSKNNNELKSKSHKDPSIREYKEKKNSSNGGSGSGGSGGGGAGHQSPKPKTSNLKVNKMDGGKLSAVIDRLTNSKTEDNYKNGNGKSSSSSNTKEVKNTAQLTDVKGNQSLTKGSQEYMIKHHDDGIKMTFNRTRTRDSGTNKTGSVKISVAPGNDSPKHTGLKQSISATTPAGAGSSTVCKKSTSLNKVPTSATSSSKISSNLSSKHSSKSSTTSSKSKSNHSPKGSHALDPNRKEKIRPSKVHSSDKSIFPNAPKRVTPAMQGDFGDVDKPYKPPYQPPLVYSTKPLDTKFQIPKISDRNKMSGSESELKKSDGVGSADGDCSKDGLMKTDSSSPIKILEERGILIEATKNTNSSYESSKSKSTTINENTLELISNPSSQHQMTSSCSMAGVPSNDSIKLNLAKFHSRYDIIGRPTEFEYSACE